MKNTRKIISLLLSVLMIITSIPLMAVNSFAADVVKSGTTGACTWTLDSDGVLTISGNGKMKDYSWDDASPWGTSITKVVIEVGVTSIGVCAFANCTSLTSVMIPDSVTSMGEWAFANCTSLTSVTIPDSVTSIVDWAFKGCTSLTNIAISDGVTEIGYEAFSGCTSLTSITIPDSVTSIGEYAFQNCSSLASITIPDSVSKIGWVAFDGTAYYNDISNWDNGLLYIGNHLIKAKEDVSGSIEIRQGTKTIAAGAFSSCASITSITIPDGVTKIDGETFNDCTSLTSITIPNSVTCISHWAFWDCTSLKSITIPDSVTSIGEDVFNGCTSLTSIIIPDSVTEIGKGAFYDCTSLANISIPDSVTSMGSSPFDGTAYYNNTSNWDNGILYAGNHLIKANDVSGSVEIKQGTKTIVDEAFSYCTSLTNVVIPDSVVNIGNDAFNGCKSLSSVTIPVSVTSIGDGAFGYCTSLTSVTIPDGVTSIGYYAFEGCTSLTRIAIPDSVTSISDGAFRDCTSLTSITIPDRVTEIGHDAFYYCTSLTNIVIPDSVTSIGDYAIYYCPSLKGIVIPESVTEIGEKALGYYYDSGEYYKNDGFAIYGKAGSAAERYANENGFDFLPTESAPSKFFPDVIRGDWYYNAVNFNVKKGYVTGYQNGTFGPANNIQRQDFVLILARIAGADLSAYEGKNGGFSDVQTGSYYASAVAWAKDKGIVTGYSADNFGVGTYISREQISLILCRYLGGEASGDVDTILNAYSDGGNTSPWAKAGVAWAVENGIIGNSDYLNPNGNAGRAEVAQIIYNMSNKGML